jgi:hypothetical protein
MSTDRLGVGPSRRPTHSLMADALASKGSLLLATPGPDSVSAVVGALAEEVVLCVLIQLRSLALRPLLLSPSSALRRGLEAGRWPLKAA